MAPFHHIVAIQWTTMLIVFTASVFWVASACNSANSLTEYVEEIIDATVSNIFRCEKLGNRNSVCDRVRYNVETRTCTLLRQSDIGSNVDASNKMDIFIKIKNRSSCSHNELMLTSDFAEDGHHCKKVAEICGPNQYRIGGKCIVFVEGPVTWYQSRDACTQIGGRLLILDSQATFEEIRELLILKNQESTFKSVWIDGSDESQEDSWITSNGSSLPWIAWAAGQPDNLKNAEHCMSLKTLKSFYSNDLFCTRTTPYMCELNNET